MSDLPAVVPVEWECRLIVVSPEGKFNLLFGSDESSTAPGWVKFSAVNGEKAVDVALLALATEAGLFGNAEAVYEVRKPSDPETGRREFFKAVRSSVAVEPASHLSIPAIPAVPAVPAVPAIPA